MKKTLLLVFLLISPLLAQTPPTQQPRRGGQVAEVISGLLR
jgi:hypothetical protein